MANANEITPLLDSTRNHFADRKNISPEILLKETSVSAGRTEKMKEAIEELLKLDDRRKQSTDRKKLYEEMLLKEIPGTSRTDEPMHAVLEGELGSSDSTDGNESLKIRNQALIHYLATLANSNKEDDTFDFDFVENLTRNGADINSTDKTGQTVFHEVARSWNIDVASFLVKKGANVNHQDHFGRSPLHVAAAVNYPEMVEFLILNGADVDIKTYGEEQAPIHFAAKNDAIYSLNMLLGYGADIDARDSKNRTPLQVSAEMSRYKAARLLVSEGAPAGVYDSSGNSALSLMIEKIPNVALEALDQFHSTDTVNRKEFYFLNYLEGTKLKDHETSAHTPLEIAVQNERFDIILHPVMQRLIGVQWQIYGKWGAVQDLVVNLVYAILWSVVGVTIPRHGRDLYVPLQDHAWRLAIGAVLILLTFAEVKKQITHAIKTRRELKKWREWRAAELERDIQYCHPRWPQETHYLQSEIKAVRNLSLISASDWWIYFEWVSLLLILAAITSHVTFFYYSTDVLKEVHHHFMIALLLILWFRIFKYARPFEGAGPFVVIFGSVMEDIVKWAFLNSVILVPYTCAFWITFGAISLHPVDGYKTIGPLLYNVFSMMVVGDHGYDKLEKANPVLARLLCGSFIGIAAIVTLNLLIALLSNTFERLYENAIANAVMQRARTILLLQKSLRKKQMKQYYNFIRENGSPAVIQGNLGQILPTNLEERPTIERVCEDVKTIKSILGERFGKRYGKEKKSDLDFVKGDLDRVKVLQERVVNNIKDMKLTLQGIAEMVRPFIFNGKSNQYDIHDNYNDANDNNDNNGDNNDNNDDNNNNNSKDNNDNDNNHNNDNDDQDKGNNDDNTREGTRNHSSGKMTGNGKIYGRRQSSYSPRGSQPTLQKPPYSNGVAAGLKDHAYPSRFPDVPAHYLAFPSAHDPRCHGVSPEYLVPQNPQLIAYFTENNPRPHWAVNSFTSYNPQQQDFTNTAELRRRRGFSLGSEDRNFVHFNDYPSLNDIQGAGKQDYFRNKSYYLTNNSYSNDRITQPVFVSADSNMIYPSQVQNFPRSTRVQSYWEPEELQSYNLQQDRRDGARWGQFLPQTYLQERLIQDHSGFSNNRREQAMEGPFANSASGENRRGFHDIVRNDARRNSDTSRQTSNQPYAMRSGSNRAFRSPHFDHVQQEMQSLDPRVAEYRIQQSPLLQEHTSSPNLSYKRKDIRRTEDNRSEITYPKISVIGEQIGIPLEDPRTITKVEDDISSRNKITRNLSTPEVLKQVSSVYLPHFADSSTPSPFPVLKQDQPPVDTVGEEDERNNEKPRKAVSTMAPTIMGEVVYCEKKFGDTERKEQRDCTTGGQDEQKQEMTNYVQKKSPVPEAVPDITFSELSTPTEIQQKYVKEI